MTEKLSTEVVKISYVRKIVGKFPETQNFPSMYVQHKLSRVCSEYFSQAINSLITGWTVYTKNVNPSVLRRDLPAVGLDVRTSGFIYFRIDSPISY